MKKDLPQKPLQAGGEVIRLSLLGSLERYVSGMKVVWLILGWFLFSGLLTFQDSLSLFLAWLPFGSAAIDFLTDTLPIGFDESILGIPWFLFSAELARRFFGRIPSSDQSS
jgi:hypothetical protein